MWRRVVGPSYFRFRSRHSHRTRMRFRVKCAGTVYSNVSPGLNGGPTGAGWLNVTWIRTPWSSTLTTSPGSARKEPAVRKHCTSTCCPTRIFSPCLSNITAKLRNALNYRTCKSEIQVAARRRRRRGAVGAPGDCDAPGAILCAVAGVSG